MHFTPPQQAPCAPNPPQLLSTRSLLWDEATAKRTLLSHSLCPVPAPWYQPQSYSLTHAGLHPWRARCWLQDGAGEAAVAGEELAGRAGRACISSGRGVLPRSYLGSTWKGKETDLCYSSGVVEEASTQAASLPSILQQRAATRPSSRLGDPRRLQFNSLLRQLH